MINKNLLIFVKKLIILIFSLYHIKITTPGDINDLKLNNKLIITGYFILYYFIKKYIVYNNVKIKTNN